MATIKADVAIIGSGQGASPLARALVDEGREVVIFERDRWGGTCVNYGCIPSKTFLASAHAAAGARHAAALGVQATVSVDFPAIMEERKLGFYRMVVNRENDLILGATLVGEGAAELIHVFVAHMMAGAPWQVLERSVHIHPTYAEALPTLARQLKSNGE